MTPSHDDPLAQQRQRIAAAYDPALLESVGHKLAELLAEHFRAVEGRSSDVLCWNEPTTLVDRARQTLREADAREIDAWQTESLDDITHHAAELARESLSRGQNVHSPRYIGHQVPAPVPLAGLFELVGTVTNQCMAIYEMGPWATAVEHALLRATGERLGFAPGGFAGLITSGGSLANLTALVTARNVTLGDAWSAGMSGRTPAPVLVVHQDSHYCVARAAGILGLGTDQLVPVRLDAQRRMDPNHLDDVLTDLRKRGVPIVAVSAAACATPIGAFDPLDAVAAVCRRHDVWMHIDAAHGGALAFSERHRHLLAGIELADSVVCDAHKTMFMPALCTMLFYRDAAHRMATFHQDAPYLFDPTAPVLADYDSGVANLECTKRAAALGAWGVWSLFGSRLFADMVDVTIDLAQSLYAMLEAADDFEPLHRPQCNIVAFRYRTPNRAHDDSAENDDFQLRLRRAVIESGKYYFVQTRLDGRHVLRATIMNPLTTEEDLQGLLDCIRATAKSL